MSKNLRAEIVNLNNQINNNDNKYGIKVLNILRTLTNRSKNFSSNCESET